MSFMINISDEKLKVIFEKFYNNIMTNEHLSIFFRDQHHIKGVIYKQMNHFYNIQKLTPPELKAIHRKMGRDHAGYGINFTSLMTAGDYLYHLFLKEISSSKDDVIMLETIFTNIRNNFAYGYLESSIEEFTETLRMLNVISLNTRVIKEYIEWFMMLNSSILANDSDSITMLEESKPSLGSVIIENLEHLKKLDKISRNFDLMQKSMLFNISKNDFRSALSAYSGLKENFLALVYIVSIAESMEMVKDFATDPLTKALTRKQMDKLIKKAAAQSGISKQEFTVAITDIDHFKKVNDTYGHKAGDIVLRDFAGLLMKHTAVHNASVIRYGGEEFVIIFPDSTVAEAAKILEELRIIIEMNLFNLGKQMIHVTSSFGLYGCSDKCALNPDPTEIVKKADEKLYQAKQEGRNRVIS